jgi:ubiquinone biosynthesis monooxygenase Coq7|tara:strand:- start:594 stop:1145 length:552 start_codon:yes stop_codon:yes gene_type:complete
MSETAEKRLPGDLDRAALVARMLRVDHAGEQGAKRIYDGQLAVLGHTIAGPIIRRMAEQEHEHLAAIDQLLAERQVRPTVLSPVWHVAGFALGAASALLGTRAAMACTVAVEDTIEAHYQNQINALGDDEADLREKVTKFRDDELEHRDTGLAHGAEEAPGHALLDRSVRAGTRLAIWLSERI